MPSVENVSEYLVTELRLSSEGQNRSNDEPGDKDEREDERHDYTCRAEPIQVRRTPEIDANADEGGRDDNVET